MRQEELLRLTDNCLQDLKKDPTLVWNDRVDTCKSIIEWTTRYLVDRYKLHID